MKKRPELLTRVAYHVTYELRTMMQCAALIDLAPTSEELLQVKYRDYIDTISHAVIEAFLIHARNLFEFMFTPSRRHDDVRAKDYLTTELEWNRIARRYKTPMLDTEVKRINKYLAHITERRVVASEVDDIAFVFTGWNFKAIAQGIVEALREFVSKVTDSSFVAPLNATLAEFS